MPLKTTLTQKQKLSLTLHMQQSLEILQMDSISLKEHIEAELERNPMLEELPSDEPLPVTRHPLDIRWEENTRSGAVYSDTDTSADQSDDPFTYIATPPPSLCDYLLEQLALATIPCELRPLVRYLILSLDDNGWLTEPPESISREHHISIDKIYDALHIIQKMEPAGVGAANCRECLLLQAHRQSLSDAVIQILESDEYLNYLSNNQISQLSKALDLSIDTTFTAVHQILSLTPKPGASFGGLDTLYVIPDAHISLEGSGFSIIIGNPSIPEIQLNGDYVHMLKDSSEPDVSAYLNNCLKQAQSLISGITQRNKTLFLCISEIVRRQPDYFKSSNGYLLPMTLSDVAETLHMSISTVSRTVKNKYISCCHGTLPLHTLFTSSVHSADSESKISSQKIQQLIRELINKEDKTCPLSDPDITLQLSYKGYTVARRTVAKYRTQLNIPPAAKRKIPT